MAKHRRRYYTETDHRAVPPKPKRNAAIVRLRFEAEGQNVKPGLLTIGQSMMPTSVRVTTIFRDV